MRIGFFTVVVLAAFPAEALAASAVSSGTEVVGVSTRVFSPAAATGSWCVGAQVDGVANNGYAYGPGGGPATPCTSVFFIKNEARSAPGSTTITIGRPSTASDRRRRSRSSRLP